MKNFYILLIISFCAVSAYSQEGKEKVSLTYDAGYNGKSHIVDVGDTVYLGYGSNPYGSFMYIYNSSPPKGLEKQYAGKIGIVSKVKYIKSMSQHQIYIKGKFGHYIVDVPQAIDKEEVVGFNSTSFK